MVFDLFRRGPQKSSLPEPGATTRVARRSSGMAEFSKVIAGREGLTILDLGPTSPQNIRAITEMGHKVYNEDVLLSSFLPEYARRSEDGGSTVDIDAFLMQNLKYHPQQFDAVLCWDVPDYLPEDLVKPTVERLALAMKPGGALLGFFHTKDAGPDAAYFRYHIAGTDTLDLQTGPRFRLQRIFNNRHIENLFREFANIKFFLARDNVREVLVTR
jgi:hypothetical protein